MVQSFAATIINAKHVSMAFCRQQQWLTNRQYTFPHGGWSHEHIDKDKQKENQLRRLLLFVEEGKHEPTNYNRNAANKIHPQTKGFIVRKTPRKA